MVTGYSDYCTLTACAEEQIYGLGGRSNKRSVPLNRLLTEDQTTTVGVQVTTQPHRRRVTVLSTQDRQWQLRHQRGLCSYLTDLSRTTDAQHISFMLTQAE